MMKSLKILLADDHQVIQDNLKNLLINHSKFKLIGVASTPSDVHESIVLHRPDFVLIDAAMCVDSDMRFLAEIRSSFPASKVIILSVDHDADLITRCLECDVSGFVVKSQGAGEIIQALETVSQGHKFFSEAVRQAIIERYTEDRNPHTHHRANAVELTTREREIVGYIIQGMSKEKIAELLLINFTTIETHHANLMRKLNARNSAELISKAQALTSL